MMPMVMLMSAESARVYKSPLRGLAQAPGGDTRGTPAPLRASPSPAGRWPGLPLCKQASCPCITWLHKEAGNRLVHPAATCPRLSAGPALGTGALRPARVATGCSLVRGPLDWLPSGRFPGTPSQSILWAGKVKGFLSGSGQGPFPLL